MGAYAELKSPKEVVALLCDEMRDTCQAASNGLNAAAAILTLFGSETGLNKKSDFYMAMDTLKRESDRLAKNAEKFGKDAESLRGPDDRWDRL